MSTLALAEPKGFPQTSTSATKEKRKAPRNPEPATRWAALLNQHRGTIAAICYGFLYSVDPDLRSAALLLRDFASPEEILHCNVTKHPTNAWIVQ